MPKQQTIQQLLKELDKATKAGRVDYDLIERIIEKLEQVYGMKSPTIPATDVPVSAARFHINLN
jgi:hypothetical protein